MFTFRKFPKASKRKLPNVSKPLNPSKPSNPPKPSNPSKPSKPSDTALNTSKPLNASNQHRLFIRLSGGLGNRLYQMASAMGIAQRSNAQLIISTEMLKNPHSDRSDELRLIASMFPSVSIGKAPDSLVTIREPKGGSLGFNDYVITQDSRLYGYFQNEHYFPRDNSWIPIMSCRNCPIRTLVETYNCAFVHVRRGDYTNHPLHNVDLHEYYRTTLQRLDELKSKGLIDKVIVFSDNPVAARKMVSGMFKGEFTVAPMDLFDYETMWLMSRCVSGICANSTFSRFAAYMARQKSSMDFFLPEKWFNAGFNHIEHVPSNVTWATIVKF